MNAESFNEKTVRIFYRMLAHSKETEVRLIDPNKIEKPRSEFAHNEKEFLTSCQKYNGKYNIYCGLNERNAKGTKAQDIKRITNFLIDIDPIRPPNTSATQEQIQNAREVAEKVKAWITAEFHKEPNMLFSGNGFQIILNFPGLDPAINGFGNDTKCKKFYEIVSDKFGNDKVKIDPTHDAARICKVSGTLSIKGNVHRLAYPINELKRRECPKLQEFIENLAIDNSLGTTPSPQRRITNIPYSERLSMALDRSNKLKLLLSNDWEKVKNNQGKPYESRSEAELATACILIYYEFSDDEIDDVMTHKSKIGKWKDESQHYKDMTIQSAHNLVEETISTSPMRFFTREGDGSFVPAYLGQEVIKENNIYTFNDNEEMILYNPATGLWEKDAEILIKEKCSAKLKDMEKRSFVEEAISFIKHRTYVGRDIVNDNLNLIPIKNGIYDFENEKLIEYTPDYFFMSRLNVTYDPQAICPTIDKFFFDVVGPKKDLLYEIMGYLLYRNPFLEKSALYEGDGSNGKSITIKLQKKFLGDDNFVSMSLQELTSNRFSRYYLYGKYANLFSDLSKTAVQDSGMFKMIVSGDPMTADRKFKEAFTFSPFAKLIFSANEMPPVEDNSEAFFRRWLIIRFPNRFEGDKKDPFILDKITTEEELSGLFNESIKALKALLKRKAFSDTKTIEEIRDHYIRISDPVGAFVMDCCEEDVNSSVPKNELYAEYKKYCQENKLTIKANNIFARDIKNHVNVYSTRETINDDNRIMVWKNIRLVENSQKSRGKVEEIKENLTEWQGWQGYQGYFPNKVSTEKKDNSTATLDKKNLANPANTDNKPILSLGNCIECGVWGDIALKNELCPKCGRFSS